MAYLSHDCKIQRAREHLSLIDKELRSSLGAPDAYQIVDESEEEEITNETRRIRVVRRVIFNREIPTVRLGVLIGDVVSNLRSALDHVIYAISLSGDAKEFRDDRTTEFPIWDDPDAFRRPHRRGWTSLHEIRGIPAEAQAIVEGLQPYHRAEVSDDPLRVLREMSNIDKHRNIHVVTYSGAEIAWDITNLAPNVTIHSHVVRPPGIVDSGAALAEMELTVPNVDRRRFEVQMNRKFFFTVAFDHDTPLPGVYVLEGLSDLIDCTEGIVTALDRFIG